MADALEAMRTHHAERLCGNLVRRAKQDIHKAMTEAMKKSLRLDRHMRMLERKLKKHIDKLDEIVTKEESADELPRVLVGLEGTKNDLETLRRTQTVELRDFFYDTCAECETSLENVQTWLRRLLEEGRWNTIIEDLQETRARNEQQNVDRESAHEG